MNEEDVYRPPTSPEPGPTNQAALGELVRSWEKTRLRYNLILLPFGLITLGVFAYGFPPGIVFTLIGSLIFGVGANFCYLAGPLVELYGRVLFFRSEETPKLRAFLYWGGVLFSLLIIGFFLLGAVGLYYLGDL